MVGQEVARNNEALTRLPNALFPFRDLQKKKEFFPMRKRRNTLEAAGNDLSRSEERTTTGQENVRNEQGEAGTK